MHRKKTLIGIIVGTSVLILVAVVVLLRGGQQDLFEISRAEERTAHAKEDTKEEKNVKDNKKEMETFKSEEYGFEFHYPKTLTMPDGRERQVKIENIDLTKGTTKESVVLRLRSYSMKFSLYVEPTPEKFTGLRQYIENLHKQYDEMSEKSHDNPSLNRIYREVNIGGEKAIIAESFVGGEPESSLYIEKGDFLYMIFYQGHLDSSSTDEMERERLEILKQLFENFTFY